VLFERYATTLQSYPFFVFGISQSGNELLAIPMILHLIEEPFLSPPNSRFEIEKINDLLRGVFFQRM
jgi:hypothetical protein